MSKVIKKVQNKLPDEKQEIIIKELNEIYTSLGYIVRIEKGLFKGGFCLLKEQRLFLLNKSLDPAKKISLLAKNLAEIGINDIYIKPELRELIERENPNTLIK